MANEMIDAFDNGLSSDIKRSDFPHNFLFGVGTSSYQVEGAWNTGGKGLSICDTFYQRNRDKCEGGENACVTVDSYSKMKEDVQLLKQMGVPSYRFSISWPRILPGGRVCMGKNTEGIDYYNKLIDELLANGIEPFVTLFHWDLPNALEEEYLGFLSSKIVDDFVHYADICFWEFGDRVKNWATLNEPQGFATSGYAQGIFPPGRGAQGEDGDAQTEPYTVAYNLLRCHAAAYRKYEEDYKSHQKGKVGITLNSNYFKPYGGPDNKDDVKAVEYAFDFVLGWFLEPLMKGTWPQSMQQFATTATVDYPNGRVLPEFSEDERKKLINSYDFLGINYYTSNYAQKQDPSSEIPLGYETDCHYKASGQDPKGNFIGTPAYDGSWIYLCPWGLRDLLYRIKNTYNVSKEIIITENGSHELNDAAKTYEQARDDTYRLNYIKEHLKAIRTTRRNHVNVTGYYVWSFMDSFEWIFGYSARFGMIYVDYTNENKRYPKNSAIWFRKFLLEGKKVPWKRSVTVREEENEESVALIKEEAQAIPVNKKLRKAKA